MTHPDADAIASASANHDSETALRAQLHTEPAQHHAALALSGLLLSDGRVDEAVALLAQHVEDRDCGDLLREYFIGERMNEDALGLLSRRGSDASTSGLVDQAVAAHLRGAIDGAMQYCRLAITAHPGYAPAHNHLGRALFNSRRADPARASLVQAVRIAPNYAEAWHNLAHVLRDAREFEQAERAYGHALRLRPAYRSALLNLGIVRIALGKNEAALETFKTLLAIDPMHAEACFNLALCEHLLLRYDDARQSYERSIAIDPRNHRAHLQYGRLCGELHDTEGALQQFRRALDLNARDPEAWAEIAKVYEQADHLDEADRAVAAGLAVAPTNAGLRVEQANIERRRGNFDAALSGLRAIDLQALPPHQHARHQQALELTLARLGEAQQDH